MKTLLFLPVLRFELHFDFTGIVWGMMNMLALAIGIVLVLIGGIISLVRIKRNGKPFRRQHSTGVLYGGLVMIAGFGLGMLILPGMDWSHHDREMLDVLAPVWLLVLAGLCIFVAVWHHRKMEKLRYGA